MTVISPFRDRLARYKLRQCSTIAVSAALKAAALDLDKPEVRKAVLRAARRIESCALTQRFWLATTPEDGTRLYARNNRACKSRICAQCEARRAAKHRLALREILDEIWIIAPTSRTLFLTLSTRNRAFTDAGLQGMLSDHIAGLQRFWKLKRVQRATLGHYTVIEIAVRTPAKRSGSIEAGVHSHSLVQVDATALSDHRYIRTVEWAALWRQAARLDYKPIIDVRAVKANDGSTDNAAVKSSVHELTKYIVASDGLFDHSTGQIAVDPLVALTLLRVLRRKRLTRFDRIFAEASKRRRTRQRKAARANPPSGQRAGVPPKHPGE